MNSLPGYDNWKLASPPEYNELPCTCGHNYEEHFPSTAYDYPAYCEGAIHCGCQEYQAIDLRDDGPDPDEAYDRRRERDDY